MLPRIGLLWHPKVLRACSKIAGMKVILGCHENRPLGALGPAYVEIVNTVAGYGSTLQHVHKTLGCELIALEDAIDYGLALTALLDRHTSSRIGRLAPSQERGLRILTPARLRKAYAEPAWLDRRENSARRGKSLLLLKELATACFGLRLKLWLP